MTQPRRYLSGLLLLWLVLASAPARDLAPRSAYLTPGNLDLTVLLAPPPTPDSATQAHDLATVLDAQASRTAAQADFATADAQVSVFRFTDVLGPSFTRQALPLTAALFAEIDREVIAISRQAKQHWRRPRPFVVSRQVTPLVKPTSDGSYPSGHAMFGYVTALLLGHMVPERRDALMARGVLYGENRVTVGVHYPTDTAAGRQAATAMAAVLLQNERFRADLAAVRQEIRGVLKLP